MTVTNMFGVGAPPVVFHCGPFRVCCFISRFAVTVGYASPFTPLIYVMKNCTYKYQYKLHWRDHALSG